MTCFGLGIVWTDFTKYDLHFHFPAAASPHEPLSVCHRGVRPPLQGRVAVLLIWLHSVHDDMSLARMLDCWCCAPVSASLGTPMRASMELLWLLSWRWVLRKRPWSHVLGGSKAAFRVHNRPIYSCATSLSLSLALARFCSLLPAKRFCSLL